MNTNTTPPRQPPKEHAMNAATIARIAAWNVITDVELPAGTKVIIKDGQVAIHPRSGQPTRVPYGPTDTISSLYDALKGAAQSAAQDLR